MDEIVRRRLRERGLGRAGAAVCGRAVQDSHRLRLFRALWAEDEVDEADLWYVRRIVGQISEEMCRDYQRRAGCA
jgi:hypothetical protein